MIDFFANSEDSARFVSVLAAVEVRSAIRRRESLNDITQEQALLAIRIVVQELRRITEHPITSTVITMATSLVDRHGLRALDSIQLATALIMRETNSRQRAILFVSSDLRLIKAAAVEGFSTWDPATPHRLEM